MIKAKLIAMVLCVLLSLANLSLYRSYVYQDYRGYIADILKYTLSHIDGDDLRACVETLEESDKYRETSHGGLAEMYRIP